MLSICENPDMHAPNDIAHYINQMPSLSVSSAKALTVCNRPDASVNELTHVVTLDPVLTAQVLRLTNSTYFALPYKVDSLARAVVMLGFNTVKNLVFSTIIVTSIGKQRFLPSPFGAFFWHHSLCVGLMAKALAAWMEVPVGDQEAYFVAGLLHDLGKIPLCHHGQDDYVRLWKASLANRQSLYIDENAMLGTNHSLTGGLIAEKWHLGKGLKAVLTGHHNADALTRGSDKRLCLVSIADRWVNYLIQNQTQQGFEEDDDVSALLSKMVLQPTHLAALWPDVQQGVENADAFLQI